MQQPSISAVFEEDHDRLDALFGTFQAEKRRDFTKAKAAFKEFKVGLQRHIVWEEEILFPLWEQKTGMVEGGPTAVMRMEHQQIHECLEAVHKKVQDLNPNSDGEERDLLRLLEAHNLKEERVLYPGIDQVLDQTERNKVFADMKDIPEERYQSCCGRQEANS